ncbi:MAG: hypothetical protein E6J73_00585 [Deltaproteobacteria bacterium]|nr:MAG: hypothetical protein E6J73_00585 [Deltaproteobacteria bacterium]
MVMLDFPATRSAAQVLAKLTPTLTKFLAIITNFILVVLDFAAVGSLVSSIMAPPAMPPIPNRPALARLSQSTSPRQARQKRSLHFYDCSSTLLCRCACFISNIQSQAHESLFYHPQRFISVGN